MALLWWHWLALGLILVALEMAASGRLLHHLLRHRGARHRRAAPRSTSPARSGCSCCCSRSSRSASLLLFRSPLLRLDEARSRPARRRLAGRRDRRCRSRTSRPAQSAAPSCAARSGRRATHDAAHARAAAQRCVVVRVDQLMIFIEPEGARCMTGGLARRCSSWPCWS